MLKNLRKWVPALNWIKNYNRADLQGDVSAGLTVAVMLIPQGMAYAMLAGLPPVIGLYSSIVPLIVYALFGTSKQLAVGPVAMVSLLVTTGVGAMVEPGSSDYISLAIMLSLMVGVIQTFMGIAKLGFLTNFLSHPIISGFTSAAALIIGFSQLKHLVGFDLPRTHLIHETIFKAFSNISEVHVTTMVIGGMGIVGLKLVKKINPMIPGALLAVGVSAGVTWMFGLDQAGVKVVGNVPEGLPALSIPELQWSRFTELLPIALTISFVGFMESIAVAKKIASEKKYKIQANQELLGLGLANVFGSLFSAFPVTGGFSRTAVNNQAGARTPLASILTAIIIGLALMFLTPLFYYIPKAILASIIMVAVFGLIDYQEVQHLWQVKKEDLVVLAITFFATLSLGIKQGIATGIVVSMLWFIIKSTRPHFAILGRIPGSCNYRNIKRHKVETIKNTLIIRFDAQFYYGNVNFLEEKITGSASYVTGEMKYLIIDGSAMNNLDSSADTALRELNTELKEKGVALLLANIKGPVMDVMKKSHLVAAIGEESFFWNVHEAVEFVENQNMKKAS